MLRTLSEESDAHTDTKLGTNQLTLIDTVSFLSVMFVLIKKNFNANPESLYRSNWVIGVWVWVLGVISLHVEDQDWLRVWGPPSEWPCRESTFWLHRHSDLCALYSLLTNEPANPKLTNLGTARWKVDKKAHRIIAKLKLPTRPCILRRKWAG